MSQSLPVLYTFKTVTNLSTTDYRFVKLSDDFTVALCGAGEAIIGIRQESIDGSSEERYINVAYLGTAKLTLGDTVTIGQRLKSDSVGRGVPSTSNTEEYGGIALEAGVVGQVVEVLVVPMGSLSA